MEPITYSNFENRYREKKYIGSGGFSKVYKVFDHAKNHYVALKVADVRPELKQFTLQREVELVNKLDPHRNIARYDACYRFNTGWEGEKDFALLKFYEYGNLEQFLNRQTDLGPEDIRIIIVGILEGLGYLHRNNIIHRDMKCQNILIHREDGVWTPKITDFGLSRQLSGDFTTTNSAVALTFAYAAPEQIRNQKIHKNVDIWAVGVIVYRVIAGNLPFEASKKDGERLSQSQLELSQKIISLDLPDKLERLPEPYRSMIKRCLVVDPAERAQTTEELLEMLSLPEAMPSPAPVSVFPEPFVEDTSDKEPVSFEPPTMMGFEESFNHYSPPTQYRAPRENPTQVIQAPVAEKPYAAAPPRQATTGRRSPPWFLPLVVLVVVVVVGGIALMVRKNRTNRDRDPAPSESPTFIPARKPDIPISRNDADTTATQIAKPENQ